VARSSHGGRAAAPARRDTPAVAGIPETLRVPAFREVWLASLASNAGSWLQIVASGWLILEATGSPAAVGALALVTRAPAIAFSAYAGSLADRFDRRLVGIWTFLLQGVAAAALAVITFAGGTRVGAIYALTFVIGLGFALGLPAMLALIPSLVPPGRLSQAVSLNAAGINVARLAGPR
jgi:MFS family permease